MNLGGAKVTTRTPPVARMAGSVAFQQADAFFHISRVVGPAFGIGCAEDLANRSADNCSPFLRFHSSPIAFHC